MQMKKFLSILLVAVMLLSAIPFTASARTWTDSSVDPEEIQAGDILTSSVGHINRIEGYTLTLLAGGYGTEWPEEVVNSDLVTSDFMLDGMPGEGLSVFDNDSCDRYCPFDENGKTNQWVVVAIDNDAHTLTLSGRGVGASQGDAIQLNFNEQNADVNFVDDISTYNAWVILATYDNGNRIVQLIAQPATQVAGTYTVGQNMYGLILTSNNELITSFNSGSCTVSVNGGSVTASGTFNADDGNTYAVSITADTSGSSQGGGSQGGNFEEPEVNNIFNNGELDASDLAVGDVLFKTSDHCELRTEGWSFVLVGGRYGVCDVFSGYIENVFSDSLQLGDVNIDFNDFVRIHDFASCQTYDPIDADGNFGNSFIVMGKSGSTIYLAGYTLVTYTVTWNNWNNSNLETDTNVVAGTTPTYNGSTPTKAADAQYTYTFSGWSPAVSAVTGNVTYTAQFSQSPRNYTITWKSDASTVINTTQVAYGSTPTHSDPADYEDEDYIYTFAGWTPALSAVTGNTTYTATYTATPKATPVASVNGVNYNTFAEAAAASHAAGEAVITPLVNLNDLPQPVYTMTPGEVLNVEYVTVGGTMYNVMPEVSDPDYEVKAPYSYTGGKYVFNVYTALKGAVKYTYSTTTNYVDRFYGSYTGTQKALTDFTQSTGISFSSATKQYNVILDLGGKTVTFNQAANELKSIYIGRDSTVTVRNGTIIFTTDDGFYVDGGNLNVESTATLIATGTHVPILVKGSEFHDTTVNIEGTVEAEDNYAIAGNGQAGYGGYTVNIKDGADVSSNNSIAVYHPNQGELNISGGTITGTTAVYVKSGTTTVTGGTLVGTGDKTDYEYKASGTTATGDAIVIDNCGFPGGTPDVTISGGTFDSEKGEAVASYVKQDDETQTGSFEKVDEIISADSEAVFSSNVTALVEDGYRTTYDETTGTFVIIEQTEANDGSNITVADTISNNYYIDTHFYGDDAVATVYYNHNSNAAQATAFDEDTLALSSLPTLKDSKSEYNGNAIFSVLQAPAQATEAIEIDIYASEAAKLSGDDPVKTIENINTYSYCKTILDGEYTANLKELAESTLDYCAAAQLYFNYNTSDLATKENGGDFYNNVAGADFGLVEGVGSKPGCIKKVSIVAKSDLEINLLSLEPIEATGFEVEGASQASLARFTVSSKQNGDYYEINVKGIVAANMGKTITIHTTAGTDIVFTANSVLKLMAKSSNANLATLAKAIYLYGAAASEYFGA